MVTQCIQPIPLMNLLVDLFNPRQSHQLSQRDAIYTIVQDQGLKLINLAEDIADKGLNPIDLPMVTEADQEGMYTVLEGNRRIAALKLLASPQLLNSLSLPGKVDARFRALQSRMGHRIAPSINCAVLSREDATHWIQLKHTGENAGIGIVPWDGLARQRFRGSSPALQAIQLVADSPYIDEDTKQKVPKISITNVERVLSTPEAREVLGVDVQKHQLVIVTPNRQEAIVRLSALVSEVANKIVKVTDLDTKVQRVAYAQRIAAMPVPHEKVACVGPPSVAKSNVGRQKSPERKSVIPRDLRLNIRPERLYNIYRELQRLNADTYLTCCSMMFRMFIELSMDHYFEVKQMLQNVVVGPECDAIWTRGRESTLREKISAVADHLDQLDASTKDLVDGVRSLLASQEYLQFVDSLTAYVNNTNSKLTATGLRLYWDSIEPLIRMIWAPQ